MSHLTHLESYMVLPPNLHMEGRMLLADLRGQRTLAAIVFTDGVSFSARMAEAEEHTLNLIRRDFQLMTELCEQFEGQVIKTTGDGLLLYFTSGVQAVACAQEIQKTLAEAAAQKFPQDVLDHRIGIHLGDVFFSGTDVMGDGVNIAARLQAEAEPRGICISQTVYDVVKHRLTLTATYLGLRELKNIQAAVPVYQILPSQSEWSTGAIAVQPPAAKEFQPSRSRQEVQNRQRLLTEVKSEVEARLSHSLHKATLINSPEASRLTRRSWDIEVKIGKQPSCKLPSWAKAIQIFDTAEIAGKLLILGAPGAGKTTTLLELAGQLVVRAENDLLQPIPVILSLSSWKDDKQTIADWLIAELKLKYGVRADISKQWLDSQQLLPLLDGLDEVRTRQHQCIQAINQFLQDGRSLHLVVCCRRVEYVQSKTHLRLNGAIRLQPLSEEQIHQDLVNAARPELWHKLEADLCLMELAQSPLLLSMMTLVYQERPLQQWSQFSSIQQRRHYLFDAYVQTMLERTIKQRWYGPFKEPTAKQTLKRLIWLAKSLTQTSQTEFLIDEMQPTLLDRRSLRIYRLGVGLVLGLIVGLHNGLIVGQSDGLLGGLSGMVVTLIAVIGYGLIAELHERFFTKVFDGPIFGLSDNLISGLMSGIVVGPIGGLTYRLVEELVRPKDGFIELIIGLLYGLVGGVIVGLSEKITTVESLKWSRTRAWKGLIIGMIVGLMLGITGVVTVKQSQGPIVVLTVGLIGVLLGGLIGGLVGPDVERRTFPNQGIWLSAVNAGVLAAIGGLMGGILDELTGKWFWGLTIGLIGGLIPGMACIQYFVLWSSLWLNGSVPWNYARFLNYATERLFLQRVGGRYRFIHNSLREHFAQLPLNEASLR